MERHRYPIWLIAVFIGASVFVQSKLPLLVSRASWLDLPLVVTLYFGLSYRNSLRGMSVGMIVGLLQDALTHGPVGMNGLSKTVVGYLASSVSGRIEMDHALIRLAALWIFSVAHLALFALAEHLFFPARFSWAHYHFVVTPILNAALGLPVFLLGDWGRQRD
jgi:rod shape-determining protein MreD